MVLVINVESYWFYKVVIVEVDGYGLVIGDVVWGGNWFFLVKDSLFVLIVDNIRLFMDFVLCICIVLEWEGVMGENGVWIDYIEFFGLFLEVFFDSCNFVLCLGGVYDWLLCGIGCLVKFVCLVVDGVLVLYEVWI